MPLLFIQNQIRFRVLPFAPFFSPGKEEWKIGQISQPKKWGITLSNHYPIPMYYFTVQDKLDKNKSIQNFHDFCLFLIKETSKKIKIKKIGYLIFVLTALQSHHASA